MPKDEGPKRIRQPKLEDLHVSKKGRTDTVTKTKSGVQSRQDKPRKEEDILRDFDLNMKYGPCCGMNRLKRWERARRFGLSPPEIVGEILRNCSEDKNKCIWVDKV